MRHQFRTGGGEGLWETGNVSCACFNPHTFLIRVGNFKLEMNGIMHSQNLISPFFYDYRNLICGVQDHETKHGLSHDLFLCYTP